MSAVVEPDTRKSKPARPSGRRPRSRKAILLEFLGSMNLAITLLVAVAIASIIGTVLLQNQPYTNYIERFGSFWFEVFKVLGLYDVYGAIWFLSILGFLVLSTSVCIYRNAPTLLRDMRQYRLNAQANSLRAFKHNADWHTHKDASTSLATAQAYLNQQGYRCRIKEHAGHSVLSAMKGAANRYGYLLTHIGIVVICIGGLMDGNLGLKVREWTGRLQPVTDNMLLVTEIPAQSRLRPGETLSFRGNRTLPEGSIISAVTIDIRDGYVLQELPFAIELKKFVVDYYPTGQPKTFKSDLVIHDDQLDQPLTQTIEVNHPLIYRGYAIYQATFGDGGSKLTLQPWPLLGQVEQPPEPLQGSVFEDLSITIGGQPFTLELDDFRFHNINEERTDSGEKVFRNWGPSYTFKLRNRAGEAHEYVNYMQPVDREGRMFFMTGVRGAPDEEFKYLRIPADRTFSLDRFMRFRQALLDREQVNRLIAQSVEQTIQRQPPEQQNPQLRQVLSQSLTRIIDDFTLGGIDAIVTRMETGMTREQIEASGRTYFNILRNLLAGLYIQVLRQEGVDVSQGITDPFDQQFFEDAYEAMGVLPLYASPFYFQLVNFEQIQASGLQITRAPGTKIVYLGCVMLTLGVFVMFYLAHRRLWLHVTPNESGSELILAGSSNRRSLDFDKEFAKVQGHLAKLLA